MDDSRPDPEVILRALQREEQGHKGGQLKIFLGMSAGVGKTYSMLEGAQRGSHEGINIVVGIVDPHGRHETEKLTQGLNFIPLKKVEYKGTVFEEMDLDSILKMKPDLVLVDELAHTNVPGSRHPKRWQDVVELLDAGIDVYTTLNVQHIESRKELVENITGINIRETVPDVLLERAAHIELVDITPVDLLQRLRDGKVYLGPQSEIAARNFFKEDRLTALRELSLRFTAEKVDHDLHEMMKGTDRPSGWHATERLLVCVSHNLHSQHLIRTARRLAFNLDAHWITLHVDNGVALDEEDKAILGKNLALARELGADVVTTTDPDVVRSILKVAKQRNVTQIIFGRAPTSRWKFFDKRDLLKRLINESGEIDIFVLHEQMTIKKRKKFAKTFNLSSTVSAYLKVISMVIAISLFCSLIVSLTGFRFVGFVYLISILTFGLFFSPGPVLLASVLSGIIMNFLFIPPQGAYVVSAQEELFWFSVLFFTSVITGVLTSRIREREALLVKRDESNQTIYEIVREIASAPSTSDLLIAVKARLGAILEGKCEIVLKSLDGGLNLENTPDYLKDEKEVAVAAWVFANAKEAGWSTSTLSSVKNLYIPLKGFNEVVGVMTYLPNSPNKTLSNEEVNLLYTVGKQLASYIERTLSEERSRKSEYLSQVEKVYQTILKSISKEYNSPIGKIKENLKSLKNGKTAIDERIENISFVNLENSSEDLGRVTENIQAMSSLCAGLVNLKKEPNSIEEVVDISIGNIQKKEKKHKLSFRAIGQIPLVSFDFSLIELLFYNILFNFIEYSPVGSSIQIDAEVKDDKLVVSINDKDRLVPIDWKTASKEKLFQLPSSPSGIGLGLAIAESIAEVHEGQLMVVNHEGKGVEFLVILPLDMKNGTN